MRSDTMLPMPPSFLWPKASFASRSKIMSPPSNIAPSETSTTEYLLGFLAAVMDQQLGQAIDIELVLGDDAAVGRAGHRREHGGKAGIAAEDLQHQQAAHASQPRCAGGWPSR